MAFNINEFQGAMTGGGARPSLFEVTMTNPFNSASDDKFRFMCRAAQIPGTNVTPINVLYFGRAVKFAGNRTFEDWTTTIINDEDFAVRAGLEEWVQNINSTEGNVRLTGANPEAYKSQAQVRHYGKEGGVLREYKFVGLFPTVVSPIDLDWTATDAIEEYQVTWTYDYFTVDTASSFGIAINT